MNQNLLHKYLKGETTSSENQEIMSWIESSTENRKEFLRYRRLYDAAIWNEAAQSSSNTEKETVKSLPFIRRWMQVAAIIAIAISGTVFIQQHLFNSAEQIFTQTIEVPQGQRVNLTLSDGTKVTLNSNSKLHFPSSFSGAQRTVVLDGEGFFEVAHNKKRPFQVITEKCEIEVLGTTFNVLAYNNSGIFETSLIEGSVKVVEKQSNQSALLKPQEKVSLEENYLVTQTFESEDDFLWREGIYVFRNEELTTVFKKLEQYYQTRIEVKNKSLSVNKCTGKFRQKEGIEHIIKVLQKANNFEYQRNEEENLIIIY
ncbi:MAG: FecR family protein [Paludibacter sp.]|nr:FecR family protein [Paludibacter sp.]